MTVPEEMDNSGNMFAKPNPRPVQAFTGVIAEINVIGAQGVRHRLYVKAITAEFADRLGVHFWRSRENFLTAFYL